MKGNRLTILLLGSVLCLTTGCSMLESAIPELSADEEELVVEYATETLLKYNTSGGGRVKHISEEQRFPQTVIIDAPLDENGNPVLVPESAEATPVPESMTMVDNPDAAEDVSVIDNTGEGGSVYTDLAELLGYGGQLSLTYTGYEVADYYPQDIGNYFVMNAQDNYKLLVLKYDARNVTGSELSVSMPYGSARFKITMNGNTKNALTTLLLNDLAAYRGTLSSGESTELVLVTEYPEGELANGVGALSLNVKSGDGSGTFTLE